MTLTLLRVFFLLPPEVLYEDLQYLSVSALALAAVAALLMLTMWLLNKLYGKIVAWRRSKQGEDEQNNDPQAQITEDESTVKLLENE